MQRLYGRADVLPRIRLGIEAVGAGRGQLLLFTGEPGIGKSRLAEYAAAEAARTGAAVAWGRCWEAGGAPAYWPWIQVFRDLQMDDDPFAGAAPGLAAAGATEARFAAFDRAVTALKEAAARRPLLLVLDDLHAADAPSLLLLLLLARDLPRTPILVVGAYREAELRLTPEIAPLLARITREGEVWPLPRLQADDVAAWVADAAASPDEARAGELYRLTEGHPLYLVEAFRLGDGRAAPSARSAGLAGLLDERLGHLGPDTRALLDVAAVLGREWSGADLAATAETGADRVHEALREAVATSIVFPTDEPDRFRFSHVLLRDRLYAELLPSRRADLHFRAGTSSLERGGDARAAIHHLFEGQSAGTPERIAAVALAAAEASLLRLAFEDAARIARRALELPDLSTLASAAERLPIQLRLVAAEASIRLGETAAGKDLCVVAADLSDRIGREADDLLVRSALVYATEIASGSIDPRMIALLRRALARLPDGDSALRARVMGRLAAAITPAINPADMTETLALMRASTAMARRLQDRPTLLYVLQFAATVGSLVPEEERFSIMKETVDLARELGQPLVLVHSLPSYITALLGRGERSLAESARAAYHALQAGFTQPIHAVRRALIDSLFCALAGDFEGSERASREAEAIARRANLETGLTLWLVHRLSLAQLRGRGELLTGEADALLRQFGWMPSAIPYVAWLLASLGRREEAKQHLLALDLTPLEIPAGNLMSLMGGSEACVLLDDRELAETLYPRLLRAASDRMFWNLGAASLLGPIARVLGDLACLAGRRAEAVRHYDEAIAFCERLGAAPLVELCRARRARVQPAPEGDTPLAPPAAPPAAPTAPHLEMKREGELWAIASPFGPTVRLRDSKGVQYLAYLLLQPGRRVHVLELVGVDHRGGDAGPVLDAQAKQAYRQRLDDLADELAEAERFGDTIRVRRAELEIDAIAEQLAGAVGLGGRDRRAASDVERTRINVQRRLKDAIDRCAAADPALGRYLAGTIKTGTTCTFQPI